MMTHADQIRLRVMDKTGLPFELVDQVFSITNERDWAIFCSQMADDGDHPEERRKAKALFEVKLENLNSKDAKYVSELITDDDEYHTYFHHMYEEIKL